MAPGEAMRFEVMTLARAAWRVCLFSFFLALFIHEVKSDFLFFTLLRFRLLHSQFRWITIETSAGASAVARSAIYVKCCLWDYDYILISIEFLKLASALPVDDVENYEIYDLFRKRPQQRQRYHLPERRVFLEFSARWSLYLQKNKQLPYQLQNNRYRRAE